MIKPLITVLMPAFNAEKYIVEAITSVLKQTFSDFELLIINDGSTDATQQLIESFTDERIRLINQTNQGISAALNIGLLNARADIIARFDADDICYPARLEKQYKFLAEQKDYILVGSDVDYVDKNGKFVFMSVHPGYTDEEIRILPYTVCPFYHPTVAYRKDAIIAAGMYDVNAHSFEDHLLWRKIIQFGKVYNIKERLIKYRYNPDSLTIDEKWRTRRFREIKYEALQKGCITEKCGMELLNILKKQNNTKIKEGAYYLLLGKKYLWDNHQPEKARTNLRKAIRIHPARMDSYAIMLLSFFPKQFINWLYKKRLQKTSYF
jgi:glycosyltransferase involved in cell wall biosynthesis